MTQSQLLQKLCNRKIHLDISGQDSGCIEEKIISLLDHKSCLGNTSARISFKQDSPQINSLLASTYEKDSYLLTGSCCSSYILIGGVGRSGTTALGKAVDNFLFRPSLGKSEKGFLFTERYSWTLPYSPICFLPSYALHPDSRFNGFLPVPQSLRQIDAFKSYHSLKCVGDKRPGAAFLLKVTDFLFASQSRPLTYVHLIRNPHTTAQSWLERAQEPSDKWPATWDHTMMAKHFISQNKIIKKFVDSGCLKATKILVVQYEKFYFDADYCAKTLASLANCLDFGPITFSRKKIDEFVARNIAYSASRKSEKKTWCPEIVSEYLDKSGCESIYESMLSLC